MLAKQFDQAIIISSNTFSEERRATPSNAVVYRFTPHAKDLSSRNSWSLLFRPFFYSELYGIVFRHKVKLSLLLLKELFAFYSRAVHTKDLLETIIKDRKINPDELLIYTYWMIESSFAAALLKREMPSIKLISRAHSLDVYFERSPVGYHPFRKFIFEQLDHLYFISENARAYFSGKHFLSEADLKKTGISRIGIVAQRGFLARAPSNTLRIISVAYIQKLKRVDLIIDALALLKHIKIEWTHVGHSNQSEADFIEIQKYAREKLSPCANISFMFTGKTSKEELFKLYEEKEFDVFLNVSETEGIPVSMMEAMSYSVPVIGTKVGGVSEIVDDGENGFFLSPYPDAREVAQSIQKFFDLTIEEKNRMRRAAFETWDEKYNAGKNYAEISREISTIQNRF